LLRASGFPSDKPSAFDDAGDFDEGINGGLPSNEPLPAVSDDMEEVKRELNEAIQKEMEMPSIISAQDEYFDQAPENLYGGARSSRSIEEESKEQPKQIGTKKEIVLNAEQFKLVQ